MNALQNWFRLLVYLVVCVVGFGGLGVWIPIAQMKLGVLSATVEGVISNLATLVISVAVTAYADFQLRAQPGAGKTKRLLFLGIVLLAAALGVCALIISNKEIALPLALAGSVLAVLKWVLVNSSNPSFGEDTNPISSLGGPV